VRIFAVLLLAAIGTAATLATLTESDIALRTATAFVALTESEIGRRAATALAALTANVISWIVVIILLMTLYSSGGLGWLGRVSLGLLVAYGYRPARVLVLALILGVGFAPIFQQAAERGLFLPKDAAAAQQLKCGPDWTQCQPHPFVPIIYSFDTMLPFKFGHADKWSLQREPFRLHLAPQMDVPIALEWLIWFEIAFGWTTSGIILALISGSLKKD
jgi:hypothetical protein